MDNIANDMLNLFRGRTDRIVGFARGKPMTFKTRMPSQEIPRYLLRHLKGHQRIGLFNYLPDGTCVWAVIEFEAGNSAKSNLEQAMLFKRTLIEFGIKSYVERSYTDRGYRVWIFFDRPIEASQLRKTFNLLLNKLNFSENIKIYPTEDTEHGDENTFGEFVWLPFYPSTDPIGTGIKQEHNIFLDDGGQPIPVEMTIGLIKTNDPGIISDIIYYLSSGQKAAAPEKEKHIVPEEDIVSETEESLVKDEPSSEEEEQDTEFNMNDSGLDNLLLWFTSETFSPISTGFPFLDSALNGGLQNGKVTQITGANAVERVCFSFQILDQIAYSNLDRELPVVIFYVSHRFGREELVLKSLCRIGELDEDYLEAKIWGGETDSDEFVKHIRDVIKEYQVFAKWIMIYKIKDRVNLSFIEHIVRQLSYKFNTPHIIPVIEDPFLTIKNVPDVSNTLVSIQFLAQQMNIPVLILNDEMPDRSSVPFLDGVVHMSVKLIGDDKSVNSMIENKKSLASYKLDKVKGELKKSEKIIITRIFREKTGISVLLPFIMKKDCNQFIEL